MELTSAGAFAAVTLALLLGGGGVGYLVSIYNTLVQLRQNVRKAWSDIDVLLQQRHDELPNLVETCRGYMIHERETLTEVTRLRARYDRVPALDDKARTENVLNRLLGGLQATWEAYPDLKANQNFLQIQGRIGGLESAIADRREFYNASVAMYNTQIGRFPDLILAGLCRFRAHEYLEVPAEARQNVRPRFS